MKHDQGWKLLDRKLNADEIDEATSRIAHEKHDERRSTQPVVIFRVGPELLALPATAFDEITEMRPIHALPHRSSKIVLGLTNVRGELLVCVSLAHVLDIDAEGTGKRSQQGARRRLVVLRSEGNRIVFIADDVYGTHWFHPDDMAEVPATVAKATASYTKAVLPWRDKAVGLLDDQLLFYTLNRSLG